CIYTHGVKEKCAVNNSYLSKFPNDSTKDSKFLLSFLFRLLSIVLFFLSIGIDRSKNFSSLTNSSWQFKQRTLLSKVPSKMSLIILGFTCFPDLISIGLLSIDLSELLESET